MRQRLDCDMSVTFVGSGDAVRWVAETFDLNGYSVTIYVGAKPDPASDIVAKMRLSELSPCQD